MTISLRRWLARRLTPPQSPERKIEHIAAYGLFCNNRESGEMQVECMRDLLPHISNANAVFTTTGKAESILNACTFGGYFSLLQQQRCRPSIYIVPVDVD